METEFCAQTGGRVKQVEEKVGILDSNWVVGVSTLYMVYTMSTRIHILG